MRNGTPTFYSSTGTVGLGTNYIIAFVGHPDTGIEVYRNGAAFGTTNGFSAWSYALTNAVGVGTPMSDFVRNFHGHLAELVLYGRALDAGEQFQVGAYLAERYDITTTYVASLAVTNLPGLVARRDTTAILGGRVTEGLAPDLWFLWSTNANLGATTAGWGGTSIVANASVGSDHQITASNLLPNTTYYWRCFASNATSTAWAPTTNSFTTHGNPLTYTPPPVTAGLVFHVDASVLPYTDNAYFEWLPISTGTPSEFLQNYSTTNNWPRYAASVAALGNRPAMRFNKSQGFIGSLPAIGANQDRTIFLVLVSTVNNTSHNEVLGQDTGTKIDVGGMVSNNTVGVRNTYWVFSEPASFSANQPYVLAITDGAAEFPRTAITINGDESAPYAYSDPSFQATVRFASWGLDTTFRIGRSAHEIPEDNRSFAGDLAEVLIYDRVLTANHHQLIGKHLANKYGITTTYRGAAGTVITIQ